MLEFGRELFQLSQRLEQDSGINETNQKMLEVRKWKKNGFYLLFTCNEFLFMNPFRTHLAYSLIQIHGRVRWVGNCAHHVVNQYVLLLILPY